MRNSMQPLPNEYQLPPGSSVTGGVDDFGIAFIGEDWILLVDPQSHYELSSAMAPCVMFAQPGTPLRVQVSRDSASKPITANALLHAPSLQSRGLETGGGGAYLYFDPLSNTGINITQIANHGGGVKSWTDAAGLVDGDWFLRLYGDLASLQEVCDWVELIKEKIGGRAEVAQGVLWRIRRATTDAHSDENGRVNCTQASQLAFWSPPHFRKSFRGLIGMTLSRYHIWRRLYRLILYSHMEGKGHIRLGGSARALLDAGFYDASHGARTLKQFFGVSKAYELKAVRNCLNSPHQSF